MDESSGLVRSEFEWEVIENIRQTSGYQKKQVEKQTRAEMEVLTRLLTQESYKKQSSLLLNETLVSISTIANFQKT